MIFIIIATTLVVMMTMVYIHLRNKKTFEMSLEEFAATTEAIEEEIKSTTISLNIVDSTMVADVVVSSEKNHYKHERNVQEIVVGRVSVYLRDSFGIFDNNNINPYIDVIHVIKSKMLVTLAFIKTDYIGIELFQPINDFLMKIKQIYNANAIFVLNNFIEVIAGFGDYILSNNTIFIEWRSNEKILYPIDLVLLNDNEPKFVQDENNDVAIFSQGDTYGFNDSEKNISFITHKPIYRLKLYETFKNIFR